MEDEKKSSKMKNKFETPEINCGNLTKKMIPSLVLENNDYQPNILGPNTAKEKLNTLNELDDRHSLITQVKMMKNTNTDAILDFYQYSLDCLKLVSILETPSALSVPDLSHRLPSLSEDQKLLIFDLDETLVHCDLDDTESCDYQIKIKLNQNNTVEAGVNIRPFLWEVVSSLAELYVIVIFTASHQTYADAVLNFLDPKNLFFKYRFYRSDCLKIKGEGNDFHYIKDLRIFKKVMMEKMIIVDNSILSFAFQLQNGIPIIPFENQKKDIELKILHNYLKFLYKFEDMQTVNNHYMKLNYLTNNIDMDETSFNIQLIEKVNNSSMSSASQSIISHPSLVSKTDSNISDNSQLSKISIKDQINKILEDFYSEFSKAFK